MKGFFLGVFLTLAVALFGFDRTVAVIQATSARVKAAARHAYGEAQAVASDADARRARLGRVAE